MRLLYNTGISIFIALAYLISPFNKKVRLWINGQRNWYNELKGKVNHSEKFIWIHCASLGEFEQGRPVIEAIKKEMPGYRIILTFFSPSGYEVRKDYQLADIICYLPSDTPANTEKFINLINPVKAIFVKYEFWFNYISLLGRRNIPLFLVSGIFRKEQHFFKWYGTFFRNILRNFTWFYVQDQNSSDLIQSIGLRNITVAGDTRFDRVVQLTATAKVIPHIEAFRGNEKLFLAGSSWRPDEEIMARYINKYPGHLKWIFAPHETDPGNVERLIKLFNVKCVKFSTFSEDSADARVMVIDNVGMLSSAYRYAFIAGIGGGFGKGIHNILEPACWSVPVVFGPNHLKFREAVQMKASGGARVYKNYNDFEMIINEWLTNNELYKKAAETAGKYVMGNTGATHKIILGIT
jgi:3-deoxy-D-manno-octulosonic-acid transferase